MRLFVVAALALLVVRIEKHHAELVALRQADAVWLGASVLVLPPVRSSARRSAGKLIPATREIAIRFEVWARGVGRGRYLRRYRRGRS